MKHFLKDKGPLFIIAAIIILAGFLTLSLEKKEKGFSNFQLQNQSCSDLPNLPDNSIKFVTKVIDGDTFLIEGGYKVRILEIDTDERNHPCYEAAKSRLEELILNKRVRLEKGKINSDQYCRYLRYVFLGDRNIGLELVREGLAVARYSPDASKYRKLIIEAEREAREKKIGCKWTARKKFSPKAVFKWQRLTSDLTKLKVVDACKAGNYLGREVIIEGKVVDSYCSQSNDVFLNFVKPYPNQCFTAVIFSDDKNKFVQEPEKYYLGKTIRIRGIVQQYKNRPEIILRDPSQIEVPVLVVP